MAILIEGMCVVLKMDRVEAKYPGGFTQFIADAPNTSPCADGVLARVAFMLTADMAHYVDQLQNVGMTYLGENPDFAVVSQVKGKLSPCQWLETQKIRDGDREVLAGWLRGQPAPEFDDVMAPDSWEYESSLSRSSCHIESMDGLTFLRHENGLDFYSSPMCEGELFIARTAPATAIQ